MSKRARQPRDSSEEDEEEDASTVRGSNEEELGALGELLLHRLDTRAVPLGVTPGQRWVKVVDDTPGLRDAKHPRPRQDGFLVDTDGHIVNTTPFDDAYLEEESRRQQLLEANRFWRALTLLAGDIGIEPFELLSDADVAHIDRIDAEIRSTLAAQRRRILQTIGDKRKTIAQIDSEQKQRRELLARLQHLVDVATPLETHWAFLLPRTGDEIVPLFYALGTLLPQYDLVARQAPEASLDLFDRDLDERDTAAWPDFGRHHAIFVSTWKNPGVYSRGNRFWAAASYLFLRDVVWASQLPLRGGARASLPILIANLVDRLGARLADPALDIVFPWYVVNQYGTLAEHVQYAQATNVPAFVQQHIKDRADAARDWLRAYHARFDAIHGSLPMQALGQLVRGSLPEPALLALWHAWFVSANAPDNGITNEEVPAGVTYLLTMVANRLPWEQDATGPGALALWRVLCSAATPPREPVARDTWDYWETCDAAAADAGLVFRRNAAGMLRRGREERTFAFRVGTVAPDPILAAMQALARPQDGFRLACLWMAHVFWRIVQQQPEHFWLGLIDPGAPLNDPVRIQAALEGRLRTSATLPEGTMVPWIVPASEALWSVRALSQPALRAALASTWREVEREHFFSVSFRDSLVALRRNPLFQDEYDRDRRVIPEVDHWQWRDLGLTRVHPRSGAPAYDENIGEPPGPPAGDDDAPMPAPATTTLATLAWTPALSHWVSRVGADKFQWPQAYLPFLAPLVLLVFYRRFYADAAMQQVNLALDAGQAALAAANQEVEDMAASNLTRVRPSLRELLELVYRPDRAWQTQAMLTGQVRLKPFVVTALARAHTVVQRDVRDKHGRALWAGVPLDIFIGNTSEDVVLPAGADPAVAAAIQDPSARGAEVPEALVVDFMHLVAQYVHKARVMFPPQYMPGKQIELTPIELFHAAAPLRQYHVSRGPGGVWHVRAAGSSRSNGRAQAPYWRPY